MTRNDNSARRRIAAVHTGRSGFARPLQAMTLAAAAAFAVACASPEEKVQRYYESGVEYLESGDLARANIQFRNALKINEEHVPTLAAMAKLAEKRKDLKMMFGLYQRIVRLEPDNVEAQIQLGRLYLIGSDETAALEQAEKALELDEGNTEALALKAGVRLRLGDSAGAVELANRVIEVEPAHAQATTVLATVHALNDDFDAALAELDRALAIDPELAVLQILRIRLLERLERGDEVLAGYKNLAETFPDEGAYRRVYAAALVRENQLEEAQRQLEALVEIEPSNLEAKLDVVRLTKELRGADAAEEKLRGYGQAQPDNADLKFALVDYFAEQESWDAASEVLRPLERSNEPAIAVRAKNKMAAIAFRRGDRDRTRALIEEILAVDEANTEALIKRAQLRTEDQEYEQAVTDLRSALNNDPDSYQAMLQMAAVFEKQGNLDLARAELAKAFEASDKEPRVARVFAQFLAREDNLVRAESILEQSLALFPRNLDNLRLLASVRLKQQDWSGANEVASIVESQEAEESAALASNIRTVALSGLKEYDQVIDLLTTRKEQAPLQTRPLAALVSAYIRTDRHDEAEELLSSILESDADNYEARIFLAQVYGAQGEAAAAEAALKAAAEANASRSEAYELLYRYYMRNDQQEEAAALLKEGLEKEPESAALRFFKADMLLSQGAREEAFALYSELIEERPNDKIIANNFVSLSNELHEDAQSAERALEVARILEGEDHPYYQDTVGWAYYRAGQYDRALEYLVKAAQGADDNPEILYHLGAAQLAAGDPQAGRATLERALEAAGEDFRFATAIRELLQQG